MLCRGEVEIIRNLSKQSFPAGSGRITVKNSLGDYLHLLKSSDFKLLVLKCAVSYSQVFTVSNFYPFPSSIYRALLAPESYENFSFRAMG